MKKIPLRRCTGCREMKPKRELIRVVRAPSDEGERAEISLDLTGKKPGRGAYVCKSEQCFNQARRSRGFERSLGCDIPAEIYDQMLKELKSE